MYVNHRPAFGLESEKLLQAFEQLGVSEAAVERGELLDVLQNRGKVCWHAIYPAYRRQRGSYFLVTLNFQH